MKSKSSSVGYGLTAVALLIGALVVASTATRPRQASWTYARNYRDRVDVEMDAALKKVGPPWYHGVVHRVVVAKHGYHDADLEPS